MFCAFSSGTCAGSYAETPPPQTTNVSRDDLSRNRLSFVRVSITFDASGVATAQANFYLPDNPASPQPAAELKSALQSALDCTLLDSTHPAATRDFYSGSCEPPLTTTALLHQGAISTIPLQTFAGTHQIAQLALELRLPDSEIAETSPTTEKSPVNSQLLSGYVARRLRSTFLFDLAARQPLPNEIIFRYGYAPLNLRRSALTLAAILLLPIALLFWLSRKALAADVADKSVVWFSYMRSLAWILNGSLLAWWAALDTLHGEALLRSLGSATRFATFLDHPVFGRALGWVPPAILWLLCYRISQPVQQRLRGLAWTKRELTIQAFYAVLAGLFPLAMFLTGLSLMTRGTIISGFYWWLAALLLRVFAAQSLLKHTGMQPHALSTGDLRDRAFTFAERLGVPLQQIYLIPSGKGQMANAFARTGNTIAFTDYLLKRMNQREVDFVLAHELTHLRLRHPITLGKVRMYCWMFAVSFLVIFSEFFDGTIAARYALVFLILSFVPYFWSRRFEYSADAGAVAATGDPGAAISALFKLSELNMMPTQWSHWREKWLTHPSTLRRANAIAQNARIPLEQVPQIALQSAAEAPAYAIPATAAPGAKLHSTQRTRSIVLKASFAVLALFACVPSLVSFAAVHSAPPVSWILFVAALPATLAGFLLLSNYSVRLMRGNIVPSLKKKFADQGVQADAWNGMFVNFSPAAVPRLYDGHATWDIGYLFFSSDRLCYWGEEVCFALRKSQITALRLAAGPPSLLPSKRLYVAWKDDERPACGVFNVACGNADSVLHGNRLTADLALRLESWWKTPPEPLALPTELATLTSPQIRAVTSQVPASRWTPRRIYGEVVWTGIFTAVAATVCGLPFHLTDFLVSRNFLSLSPAQNFSTPGAGWYAVTVAVAARFIVIIPLLRYRDQPKLVAQAPNSTASVPLTPIVVPPRGSSSDTEPAPLL